MRHQRLELMIKQAAFEANVNFLDSSEGEFPTVVKMKQPEMPKTPKGNELKLSHGKGKSKPAFSHEMKTNSPYNSN